MKLKIIALIWKESINLDVLKELKKQNLKKDLRDMKWSRKSFWNNIKPDGTKLLAKLNKLQKQISTAIYCWI